MASPRFHRFAERFWLTRPFVRREGAAIFDLMSGFVQSQVLFACVELDLFEQLKDGPLAIRALAHASAIPESRFRQLCRAAVALDLLRLDEGDQLTLAPRGIAVQTLPGLRELVLHHAAFYKDMGDPLALMRGDAETELAAFWPYVKGQGTAPQAAKYSRLMAETQAMVIRDTLDRVDLRGWESVLDIGGSLGRFAHAVHVRHPALRLGVLDLPEVLEGAELQAGIVPHPQSFLSPLPQGYRAISLIRVLYDHSDETVLELLKNIHASLPAGGRLLVSEPMAGQPHPDKATDVYFAFYTMAMRTGTVRSPEQIGSLLSKVGFQNIESPAPFRPFVTRILTAKRP